MTDQDWSALAAEVRRRRERFRLPQDLAPYGGPSEFTVRKIESGAVDGSIRPHTKTRLERALRMPSGLVDKILDGAATAEDLNDEVTARGGRDGATLAGEAVEAVTMERTWAALGHRVRRRRGQLRISQEEIADRGGPSAKTVYAIERGMETTLRPSTLRRLDNALAWREGTSEKILGGEVSDEDDDVVAGPACSCTPGSPAWIERELATERRINAIAQVFQGEMQRLLALVEAARRG